jgi:uncharacterized protein YndB with AHSA1/START domain
VTATQETIDGRPALRVERRLAHPIERVWRAVTEPAELAQWFVATVDWIPEEGETFEAGGERGRITTVDPPRALAWEWGAERYRFELAPDGPSATALVFTHVFSPELGPGWQHAAGWETYFNRLDAHLDGGHLTEQEAHEGITALMERYRAEFDVA